MKTPPDLASAPPPVSAAVWELTKIYFGGDNHILTRSDAMSIGYELAKAVWNTALAAPPPAPVPCQCIGCCGLEFGNALPAGVVCREQAAQPAPEPSHQDGDVNKCMEQVSPSPHTAPSSSTRIEGDGTPPQPGDAERMARLREWFRGCHEDTIAGGPLAFMVRMYDAAQSALAESQENIRLLEKAHASNNQALSDTRGELAASQAEVERLREACLEEAGVIARLQLEANDLNAKIIAIEASVRLRSPVATGEDLNNATYLSALPLKDRVRALGCALAAARAEGVREGAEKMRALDEAVIEAARKCKLSDFIVHDTAATDRGVVLFFETHEDADKFLTAFVTLAARDAALTEKK